MCCCALFVGNIPPMSLQNPKIPSKSKRAEIADEAELFCISASKTVVFARLLVSVNDLHRGLSSPAFRVEQITQNLLPSRACGFDPRHRHQKHPLGCFFSYIPSVPSDSFIFPEKHFRPSRGLTSFISSGMEAKSKKPCRRCILKTTAVLFLC